MAARERLNLPHSRGWVDFIDLEQITGGDMRKIRAFRGGTVGEVLNGMSAAAAEVFVAGWDIPGKNLAIPRRDPLAIEKLHYADCFVLERALGDLVEKVLGGEMEEAAGSPPQPATD